MTPYMVSMRANPGLEPTAKSWPRLNPHRYAGLLVTKRSICLAILVPLLTISASACGVPTVRQLRHQPTMAAESAEAFARVAFIEGNARGAYELMCEEVKHKYSVEAVVASIDAMNTPGRPSVVEATEYEPIFGQPAMNIFLHGRTETRDIYYRFVMIGTEQTGYRVGDFFKGNGPYPPSSIRKRL
jgi:hypothetical protein